jgi:hypothetical protein
VHPRKITLKERQLFVWQTLSKRILEEVDMATRGGTIADLQTVACSVSKLSSRC